MRSKSARENFLPGRIGTRTDPTLHPKPQSQSPSEFRKARPRPSSAGGPCAPRAAQRVTLRPPIRRPRSGRPTSDFGATAWFVLARSAATWPSRRPFSWIAAFGSPGWAVRSARGSTRHAMTADPPPAERPAHLGFRTNSSGSRATRRPLGGALRGVVGPPVPSSRVGTQAGERRSLVRPFGGRVP